MRSRRSPARGLAAALAALAALACAACAREPAAPRPAGTGGPPPAPTPTAVAPPAPPAKPAPLGPLVEVVYEGALGTGWGDWGWSPKTLGDGPARLDLSGYGGWILAHPGLTGRFGALVFRMSAPPSYGDFLEVRLDSDRRDVFPPVLIRAEHRAARPDGWFEVVVPLAALDPEELPFDRIILRAARPVGAARVSVDHLGLTAAPPAPPRAPVAADEIALSIDCRGPSIPVSPLIYGIAYDPRLDGRDHHQFALGAAARRWGGNPASRYNWELGHAWNTASDWFFENVDYRGSQGIAHADFLRANAERGLRSALTVPILGWVAKDTASYAFPVSELGPQRNADPYKPDAGDGYGRDGKPLRPGSPARTSVAAPPESIRRWVERLRADDQRRGARSVDLYILDNEPMLWSSTHRDVHPEPTSYDELLDRTLAYAGAVRAADPGAVIAGPALWGWPAYFFSAKDAAAGFRWKPDRRAHGDVPFLAWYLRKLREHEQKTGVRLLDVVDVHFYPQASRVGGPGGGTDAATAALRLRSTRALWDPGYVDESWIKDTIQLIPRLKQLVAENYPGLGIAIGEYNFGAEQHPSGGLAVAEALGRFAEGGVQAAFYWTYPADRSPAFWAFRAYRDFDGKGGHFLSRVVPSTAPEGVSLFASRDDAGGHLVAVLLNLRPDRAVRPRVALTGCARVVAPRAFRYAGGPDGFTPAVATADGATLTTEALPPYSITVLDLPLEVSP
jgi:hypothetical protein